MITVLRSLRVHTREGWPAKPTAGDVLYHPGTQRLYAVHTGKRWHVARFTVDSRPRYVWVQPVGHAPIQCVARVLPRLNISIAHLDVLPGPGCSHLDLNARTALRRDIAAAWPTCLERP